MSIKLGIELELQHLSQLAPAGYFLGLHIRFTSPLITFQTYDQAWTDHYTEKGYAMRDPMIAWGFSTVGATRWSEIPVPDTFGIMGEAAAYQLAVQTMAHNMTLDCAQQGVARFVNKTKH